MTNENLTAVVRVGESGCGAWVEEGQLFIRPICSTATLKEMREKLLGLGFRLENIFIENCMFSVPGRPYTGSPRYRFVLYGGWGIGDRYAIEEVPGGGT